MADLPPYSDAGVDTAEDIGMGSARQSNTGTPRWVKVFGGIAIVVVLLFLILLLTGGSGGHGPGRHSGGGGQTPTSGVTGSGDGGHTAPPGTDHGAQQR